VDEQKAHAEDALFLCPKPPLQDFTKAMDPRLEQSPAGAPEISRVLRHCRAPADCFGANPVASALGNSAGRDPGEAVRTYHEDRKTNPKTGTFYLAGNRNFLFGSDSGTDDSGTDDKQGKAQSEASTIVIKSLADWQR
jgi:hypothetical protein